MISTVQLVTITYDGDAQRDALEAFGARVLGSAWYAAVGAEYGLGTGAQVATVHLAPAPVTLSRAQIEAQLTALVTTQRAPGPTADLTAQPLYLMYVPSSVTLSDYHATIQIAGAAVPYAVVRADATSAAATTLAAARALINTASDPYPFPHDGFFADPPASDPWSLVRGEIADLCAGDPPIALDAAQPDLVVPRVYSNRAAASDGSPCVPISADDEWNDVSADPPQLQVVAAGGTATFHLVGWSTQPMPDWMLQLARTEHSDLSFTDMAPALDRLTINNDQQVTLTLHAPASAQPGQVGGLFVLSGPSAHPWTVGIVIDNREPSAAR